MIGVFRHHPLASGDSCAGLLTALRDRYEVRLFSAEQLTDRALEGVQMLAFPGGVGEMDDWRKILLPARETVQRFVRAGNAYLGLCMGAYWAGPDYFDLLADVYPLQYIRQAGADIRRSYRTVASVTWQGQPEDMYFWDGPAFVSPVRTFRTWATYANGQPMAIMQGTVGLIGCHPEALRSWFKPKRLAPYWHEGAHHELLYDFVAELMARRSKKKK